MPAKKRREQAQAAQANNQRTPRKRCSSRGFCAAARAAALGYIVERVQTAAVNCWLWQSQAQPQYGQTNFQTADLAALAALHFHETGKYFVSRYG